MNLAKDALQNTDKEYVEIYNTNEWVIGVKIWLDAQGQLAFHDVWNLPKAQPN